MNPPGAAVPTNDDVIAVLTVERVFTPAECDSLIQAATATAGRPGGTGQADYQQVRRSTVWAFGNDPKTRWVFERLGKLVTEANRHYRYELRGFVDLIQVARYAVSDHFDWHIDLGRGQASLRKVSITVQLSDPSDYDGGELEFQGMPGVRQSRARGTAIIFPAFLPHRVTPVTRGTRYSLVGWVSGPPFR